MLRGCRFADQLVSAADHLQSYLERADKKVSGTTYKELRDLVERIEASGCFNSKADAAAPVAAAAAAAEQSAETVPVESEPGISEMMYRY